MRHEVTMGAGVPVPNRFSLVHVATAITKKFHRPAKDRVQDTINQSLAGLAEGRFQLHGGIITLPASGAAAPVECGGLQENA
jgi:hypothetical protein